MFRVLSTALAAVTMGLGANAMEVSVLPASFSPKAPTMMCSTEWGVVEYISATVTHNVDVMERSGCSEIARTAISAPELTLQVHVEQYADWCDDTRCVNTYSVGVYRTEVYGMYIGWTVGPDPIVFDPDLIEAGVMRQGLLSGVAYTILGTKKKQSPTLSPQRLIFEGEILLAGAD